MRTLVGTVAWWAPQGPIGWRAAQGMPVPATVRPCWRRIDRLAPEEEGAVADRCGAGTDALRAATGHCRHARGGAAPRLAHLQAAEFLYETRLFPEPEYTFKHALTHEVAYGGLLLERRRVLHARLVEEPSRRWRDRGDECGFWAKGLPAGRRDPNQVERLAHALRGEMWDKGR